MIEYRKLKMSLVVYIPGNGQLLMIPVMESDPYEKALLCTIYTAVHYLCEHPISRDSPLYPEPMKDFGVEPYCNPFRVFIDISNEKVFKLFDEKSEVEKTFK